MGSKDVGIREKLNRPDAFSCPGLPVQGVTRPDGMLVNASGLDLGEVVNLVRGLPNSPVQLQIAQVQNRGGFAVPTTVTLI